jgi:hypothetical protein
MKKANTFLKFLETVHPLSAEVHYNEPLDMKIYKTSHSFEEREHLTQGHPLGDPEKRKKFYDKCIRHVIQKEPRKLQEFLFYDLVYEQGMVMAYRPDSLRKGFWCMAIITILPFQKKSISKNRPDTKLVYVREKILNVSRFPRQVLEYVLDLMDQDKLKESFYNVNEGICDTSILYAPDLIVSFENNAVDYVGSKDAYKTLKLVEV